MLRNRPYLIGFLVGLLIFAIPIYMLVVPRDPCIETTDFHMEPDVVRPGQKFSAVWTDKTLRDCEGMLSRKFIDLNGTDVWVFPVARTVRHGPVGSVNRFHTPWIAPDAPPGTKLVFRKDFKRWSNPIQSWWPMEETQDAPFSIAESAQEPRRP